MLGPNAVVWELFMSSPDSANGLLYMLRHGASGAALAMASLTESVVSLGVGGSFGLIWGFRGGFSPRPLESSP